MKTHKRKFNGPKLNELRVNQGMRLEEVATMLGVDTSTVSNWENAERQPEVSNLKKISEFFKVPIKSLFLSLAVFCLMTSLAYADAGRGDGMTAVGEVIRHSNIDLLKGDHKRLAPNFTAHEFWCHDGCMTSKVDGVLLYKLELLRSALGDRPIVVTSGFRCHRNNKKAGGAKHSQHLTGKAADIKVAGVSMPRLAAAARKVGFSFIKVYGDHVHVDVR